MKKLFLALVCFASVAFFASCGKDTDKNPLVSINADKTTIKTGEEVTLTITADANATSKKDLSSVKFVVFNNGENAFDTTYTASGLTFKEEIVLALTNATGANTVFECTATATDAAGLKATKSVNITVEPKTEEPLESTAFTWNRKGSNHPATGLDQFGLEWKGNYQKAIYATITPASGVTMYEFASSVYTDVVTESQKVAAFEKATVITQWKEFNVAGSTSQTFDKVIGTKTSDGKYHLIHITKGTYTYTSDTGTDATITGVAK